MIRSSFTAFMAYRACILWESCYFLVNGHFVYASHRAQWHCHEYRISYYSQTYSRNDSLCTKPFDFHHYFGCILSCFPVHSLLLREPTKNNVPDGHGPHDIRALPMISSGLFQRTLCRIRLSRVYHDNCW